MNEELQKTHLNLNTARARWSELTIHFARGVVLRVHTDLDLVEVAHAFIADDTVRVEDWLSKEAVAPVSDEEALQWSDGDAELWSVVVAPWVLVQEDQ